MASITIIKPVENLRGLGEVFNKDKLVARVSYNLDIIQEECITDPPENNHSANYLESTIGRVLVIEKGKKLHGSEILTLLLRDNRKLDFRWHRADPVLPKYELRSNVISIRSQQGKHRNPQCYSHINFRNCGVSLYPLNNISD
jgi:hypothetical protein